MNFTIFGRGSYGSNPYWLRAIRTSIARAMLWLGMIGADWAERGALRIAPWLDEPPAAAPTYPNTANAPFRLPPDIEGG